MALAGVGSEVDAVDCKDCAVMKTESDPVVSERGETGRLWAATMRLANSDTKPQGSLITTGPDPNQGC